MRIIFISYCPDDQNNTQKKRNRARIYHNFHIQIFPKSVINMRRINALVIIALFSCCVVGDSFSDDESLEVLFEGLVDNARETIDGLKGKRRSNAHSGFILWSIGLEKY